jgi:hypothetical protein
VPVFCGAFSSNKFIRPENSVLGFVDFSLKTELCCLRESPADKLFYAAHIFLVLDLNSIICCLGPVTRL